MIRKAQSGQFMDGRGRSKDINFKSSEESYYLFFFCVLAVFPLYLRVFVPWRGCRLDRTLFEVFCLQTLHPVSYSTCLLTVCNHFTHTNTQNKTLAIHWIIADQVQMSFHSNKMNRIFFILLIVFSLFNHCFDLSKEI